VEPPLELSLKGLLQNPNLPEHYYKTLSAAERQEVKLPAVIDESNSFDYRLQGLILHSGNTRGGHYKSLCLQGEEWWEFDDTRTFPI
jgi:ubiquitin C-terminal hydrolase